MKNMYGLLIALGLGVAGALLNWSYLARKSRDVEREAFLGVAEKVSIRPGDVFKEEDLVAVEIPKNRVGLLREFAVLYGDRFTVIGGNAVREFEGGQLILRQDLKSPPAEPRALSQDEREIGIPVDTRTFVPSLYRAGDWISFVVPKLRSIRTPTIPEATEPAEDNGDSAAPQPTRAATGTETIGPFEIRTIGNRVASSDVSRASRQSPVQENVLNIIVKVHDGELDEKAQKLSDLLLTHNVRQFVILGHPRPGRE
jgi:hypothetical protein